MANRDGLAMMPIPRRRLWLGLVLAPAAWVIAFGIGYLLASRSCEGDNGMHATGVPAMRWVNLAVSLVMAGAAGFGLVTAVRSLREARDKRVPNDREAELEAGALEPEARGPVPWWGRELFIARAGVIGSSLFLAGTLLFVIPPLVVNVCSQAT